MSHLARPSPESLPARTPEPEPLDPVQPKLHEGIPRPIRTNPPAASPMHVPDEPTDRPGAIGTFEPDPRRASVADAGCSRPHAGAPAHVRTRHAKDSRPPSARPNPTAPLRRAPDEPSDGASPRPARWARRGTFEPDPRRPSAPDARCPRTPADARAHVRTRRHRSGGHQTDPPMESARGPRAVRGTFEPEPRRTASPAAAGPGGRPGGRRW